MERAEKQGLAIAAAGHVALFVVLSLGLLTARIPKPPVADAMDVTIADAVAVRSAAPAVSQEAPKASEAPERGTPEDDAAPPPVPTPVKAKPPKPEPTPPPEAKPTPPPEAKPTPPPKAKRTPPEPEPKSEPKPKAAPKPETPKPAKAKPDKPSGDDAPAKPDRKAKPSPAKPRPTPSSPAKSAPAPEKAPGLPSDFLKDLPKQPGKGRGEAGAKPRGSRLGADFLKGIGTDKAAKADAPRAAAVSARSMASVIGLLAAKVKPCYNPPTGGADAGQIVTTLSIRMNRDGSVASVAVAGQSGASGANAGYAKQMADAARRAVLRCSPITGLPADLYQGGWDDFDFRFRPEAMQ